MAEEHTTINDLPTPALCNIFRFCEKHSYVAICCVCRQWLLAFVHSQFPLPALKLTAPQPEHHAWLQQFAKRLVRLSLRRVDNLSWITSASNLQSLHLEECRHLEQLSPLPGLPCLSALTLASCRSLRDLSSLRHVQLTALTIDRCFARDLTPLSGHPTLQELYLGYDVWVVMGLQLPEHLPALRRLRISSAIQDLSPLAAFTSLQELEVFAVSVYDISPLSCLTNLQELDLHQLQEDQLPLDALGPLAVLSSLRCLGLQGCDASIAQHCPWHCFLQLTRVDLHGSCVSDLAPLQAVSGLASLDLTEARELVSLAPLSRLAGLSELVLTGCRKVADLRPVLHIMQAGGLRKP
ncbi:hypothetical protein OEZ86_011021 [Tetradesmus obliquus]|nr:hypothetical protein OEZ86_011021 [Tetradesmus obliquus]